MREAGPNLGAKMGFGFSGAIEQIGPNQSLASICLCGYKWMGPQNRGFMMGVFPDDRLRGCRRSQQRLTITFLGSPSERPFCLVF